MQLSLSSFATVFGSAATQPNGQGSVLMENALGEGPCVLQEQVRDTVAEMHLN